MKIQNQDDRSQKQEVSSITGFLSQYMQTQFQSVLSQYQNATVPEDSPLNTLLKTNFIQMGEHAPVTLNQANLNTQPLAALDFSAAQHDGVAAQIPPTVSVASLQSQGVLNKVPSSTDVPFQDIVQEASQKYDVPVTLINAVIKQESAFRVDAQSGAGAQGLMQLMPATAKAYGCNNSFDARQNVMAGTHFLSDLLKKYQGDVSLALAGYNAGPGNVAKYGNQIPPFAETQKYVVQVQKNYQMNIAALEHNTSKFA